MFKIMIIFIAIGMNILNTNLTVIDPPPLLQSDDVCIKWIKQPLIYVLDINDIIHEHPEATICYLQKSQQH